MNYSDPNDRETQLKLAIGSDRRLRHSRSGKIIILLLNRRSLM